MLTVSENYHGVHRSFTPTIEKPIIEETHETPLTRAANEILAHGGLVNMDEEYQREFVNKFAGGKWPRFLSLKKSRNAIVEIDDGLEPIITDSENVYKMFKKSLSGINPYILYVSFGISRYQFERMNFSKRLYRIKNVKTGQEVENIGLTKACELAKQKLNLSLKPASVSHFMSHAKGYIDNGKELIAIATRIRKIRRVILKKS